MNLTSVDPGIAQKTAPLAEEADRRQAMLNVGIGAKRLTADRENEGLAVFIEQRANESATSTC